MNQVRSATSQSRTGKSEAVLVAAAEVFLRNGYVGSSMDEIAEIASVSKQTLYNHFESKDHLFVQVVFRMTSAAGDDLLTDSQPVLTSRDLEAHLVSYASRQLRTVVTPSLMNLRRLVIGEVPRFPDLARALYQGGPVRAQTELATLFLDLERRGLLRLGDPVVAASQFNWLVMAEPVNRAMLLGDAGIPPPEWLERHAAEAVSVFLAAYGKHSPTDSVARKGDGQ